MGKWSGESTKYKYDTDKIGTSDSERGGVKTRIATGKICRCLKCYCCEEWFKSIAKAKGGE
ncbi:MAG: hypothetical protein Unbinned3972contig1001_62 [Prokaryotic dsDNA virus sp.]|nr:MAG: hypothetical protein Unbinned3972contig1001_62 [Prokaryotic dsDNA virus sp.]